MAALGVRALRAAPHRRKVHRHSGPFHIDTGRYAVRPDQRRCPMFGSSGPLREGAWRPGPPGGKLVRRAGPWDQVLWAGADQALRVRGGDGGATGPTASVAGRWSQPVVTSPLGYKKVIPFPILYTPNSELSPLSRSLVKIRVVPSLCFSPCALCRECVGESDLWVRSTAEISLCVLCGILCTLTSTSATWGRSAASYLRLPSLLLPQQGDWFSGTAHVRALPLFDSSWRFRISPPLDYVGGDRRASRRRRDAWYAPLKGPAQRFVASVQRPRSRHCSGTVATLQLQ